VTRPPLAALAYGLLLAAMAVGQLASLGAFERALESYGVFGRLVLTVTLTLPALELLAVAGLLAASKADPRLVRVAAVLGALIAALWAALAGQAFARGLVVENCGCFGAYFAQELRWWVLLEDVYFVALALLAARSVGALTLVPARATAQPPSSFSLSRTRSSTLSAKPGSAGGSSRPRERSPSTVDRKDL
jgi:hypothetical protein